MDASHKMPALLAAFIPLSSAARSFVAEAASLGRILRLPIRYYFPGDESAGTRDALLSLFPDGAAPSRENLVIREVSLSDLIISAANETPDSLIVLGPLDKGAQEDLLPPGRFGRVIRDSPASFLLLRECSQKGTRFRRIVCGVRIDEASDTVQVLAHAFARAFFADRLCFVRAIDDGNPCGEAEELMLREAVSVKDAGPYEIVLDCIPAGEGRGVFDYAFYQSAQLTMMSAPLDGDPLWRRLFDSITEPYIFRLPCSLLIYRNPGESQAD
jgi:hypothetical protein